MKKVRRAFKKFLKLFIKIESVPFNDNGTAKEYCTLFVCRFKIVSATLEVPDENKFERDEYCDYLGIN